jgi:hypothetical protein
MNEKDVLEAMEKEIGIMEESLHNLHILCSKISMLQDEIGEVFINRFGTLTNSKEKFRDAITLMYNMLKAPDAKN